MKNVRGLLSLKLSAKRKKRESRRKGIWNWLRNYGLRKRPRRLKSLRHKGLEI